ncbi:MAG TPA: hypothetical protein VFC00_17300 [Micromonosporaceae bacterium]|nr:hypothetical protein [Micromonosporaceae bacterium]
MVQTLRPGRVVLGAVLGLVGHALAFVAGIVAAGFVEPSEGGGFEDLAAAIGTFFIVEALVAIACLVAGVVLLVRGRRDVGAGLLAGWFVGLIAVVVVISM